jgi:transposase
MDSSTFELFSDVMTGAGAFNKNGRRKGGVKAHMVINARHLIPEICYFTEAKENDRVLMEKVQLSPGAILVFDKGFVKHGQWQQWTERDITWVTRMNDNAYYELIQDMPISAAQRKRGIISDQYVLLGRGTNVSTEIIPARRIVYYDRKKKREFSFLTNNESYQPFTIAGLYKKRWAIETKFKSLKQNFQLKYFLGDSPNAIKIQLWCALIADLLIRIVNSIAKRKKWSYANLRGLIRMHMGTYVNLIAFLNSPEEAMRKLINEQTQLSIEFNST